MILPIYAYGSPILKEVAQEIPTDYEGLEELVENMFETMYNASGVGLAAPQVGLGVRIFVIDTEQLKDDDSKKTLPIFGVKQEFINPIIHERAPQMIDYEEGCLSIPGITGKVSREAGIKMTYYDRNFQKYEATFDGMEARVIQHEYDHLEGILFTDYFKAIKKRRTKSKLDEIMHGNIETEYPVKYHKLRRG